MASTSQQFPCSITITIPLPTPRLATAALRALSVDAELSPLVRRSFSLQRLPTPPQSPHPSPSAPSSITEPPGPLPPSSDSTSKNGVPDDASGLTVLSTEYRATTNRMLRVAVNGFMESLGVVLGVMAELDVDVLLEPTSSS